MVALNCGGTVVTQRTSHLDADALIQCVIDNQVTDLTIVGDAFARPILAALDAAQDAGTPYDLSRVGQIASSGVMWSSEIKEGLLRHHDMILNDIMGSTEGSMGGSISTRDGAAKTAKFMVADYVKVLNEDDEPVKPGSGEMGMVATAGIVPRGYYKDEEKSARTFRVVNGIRYSFPGDYATVEADGSITLLGRGSQCINTGGEKVFTEEVEEAIKRTIRLPTKYFSIASVISSFLLIRIGFCSTNSPTSLSLSKSNSLKHSRSLTSILIRDSLFLLPNVNLE